MKNLYAVVRSHEVWGIESEDQIIHSAQQWTIYEDDWFFDPDVSHEEKLEIAMEIWRENKMTLFFKLPTQKKEFLAWADQAHQRHLALEALREYRIEIRRQKAAAVMGSLGGKAKTPAKAAAARANGAKGGRPKKDAMEQK